MSSGVSDELYQTIYDDGVHQISLMELHHLEKKLSHKCSVESMMNQERDLETSKL